MKHSKPPSCLVWNLICCNQPKSRKAGDALYASRISAWWCVVVSYCKHTMGLSHKSVYLEQVYTYLYFRLWCIVKSTAHIRKCAGHNNLNENLWNVINYTVVLSHAFFHCTRLITYILYMWKHWFFLLLQ